MANEMLLENYKSSRNGFQKWFLIEVQREREAEYGFLEKQYSRILIPIFLALLNNTISVDI